MFNEGGITKYYTDVQVQPLQPNLHHAGNIFNLNYTGKNVENQGYSQPHEGRVF